ncbi:MAG: COG4315 family predicted lipoprotein [Bacillota bacterium]
MKKWMLVLSIFATILFLAACGNKAEETVKENQTETNASKETAASLQLLENKDVGEYLADSKGMTLYYFKNDESRKSNCAGDCLAKWPPFTEKEFDVPENFDEKDFGTIKRGDTGAEQVTYKGFPLYYFVNDKKEGDVNGQGVKDVWFIVNSETVFQ